MGQDELKEFLDSKAAQYNHPAFIETDPIQIPHGFSKREDIEIAAYLTATISWGNRTSIIGNARRMMDLMGNAPYDFVVSYSERDLAALDSFVHRTFNGVDFQAFIRGLRHVYETAGGPEALLAAHQTADSLQPALHAFRKVFLEKADSARTAKHVSDPMKNSAAKRLNMFLRWMVRRDTKGVDFGLWTQIPMSVLSCPLDVHSGNVARKLGLLSRSQNDAKALFELDQNLRRLDPRDPVKYDFALFGLGAFEKF
ncbi:MULTISPECIES: TIGR02757 family protein [unclassified Flavobacterium]|uniref:TIGR02757 family protein n=1 Tax=unclassified Flavobacterium TaxID=196869 RepID=UPI001F140E3E|nr:MULTISPECIES: TIGR02757 family protein [unclassified Flavobacterium]UMY64839.1 TIGR02757 family protein [Flavobacterium sp. HJ-32-4]